MDLKPWKLVLTWVLGSKHLPSEQTKKAPLSSVVKGLAVVEEVLGLLTFNTGLLNTGLWAWILFKSPPGLLETSSFSSILIGCSSICSTSSTLTCCLPKIRRIIFFLHTLHRSMTEIRLSYIKNIVLFNLKRAFVRNRQIFVLFHFLLQNQPFVKLNQRS